MKSFIRIPVIVLLAWALAFSAPPKPRSRILGAVQAILPNYEEVAWMATLANVYMKVSGFTRATVKLADQFKQAEREFRDLRTTAQDIYGSIERLKDIDPYNMGTWIDAVEDARYIIRDRIAEDLVNLFDDMEWNSVGAAARYGTELGRLAEFDVRKRKNQEIIKAQYEAGQYEANRIKVRNALKTYSQNAKAYLVAQKVSLQNEKAALADQVISASGEQNQSILARIKEIDFRLASVEQRILLLDNARTDAELSEAIDQVSSTPIDNYIRLSEECMSVNLSEIQSVGNQLEDVRQYRNYLRDEWKSLTGSEVRWEESGTDKSGMENITPDQTRFGPGGDQADPPERPTDATSGRLRVKAQKADIKDIMRLRNQITYAQWRVEVLEKEMIALKANTMALILVYEGLKQRNTNNEAKQMAVSAVAARRDLER